MHIRDKITDKKELYIYFMQLPFTLSLVYNTSVSIPVFKQIDMFLFRIEQFSKAIS